MLVLCLLNSVLFDIVRYLHQAACYYWWQQLTLHSLSPGERARGLVQTWDISWYFTRRWPGVAWGGPGGPWHMTPQYIWSKALACYRSKLAFVICQNGEPRRILKDCFAECGNSTMQLGCENRIYICVYQNTVYDCGVLKNMPVCYRML